ncbi:thyroxine-binding globulin-like [Pholidichthys leucotaenia]
MSVACSFTCLTVLALLTCCLAYKSSVSRPDKVFSWLLRKEGEVIQLNVSALNTALAFEPFRDLATRTSAEPGVQLQQQSNILFSPIGLASALALLCQASGFEHRSQVLKALGLAANSTEQSVEATILALADLQQSFSLQEGGGGGVAQKTESESGAREDSGIGGAAAGEGNGGMDPGTDVGKETGSEDSGQVLGQLRVWSSLHADGKPSLDFESFLSKPQHSGPSASNASFETVLKDLQTSDKLVVNNFVYFKGLQPFEQHYTTLRRFQLNATASVEVAMMFVDDSSEVMMLYDTNCTATVVQLAQSERLVSLLVLPKGQLQPLEDCLSNSRMSFWLSNLKPGRAEIRFPKFQLRKSYSLESLLRNAGVSSMFTPSADFSGISQKMKLSLVKASHEVMLDVAETKLHNRRNPHIMLDFAVPPRITFDRPFMLIIYDNLTGLILLIGRITDPTDI